MRRHILMEKAVRRGLPKAEPVPRDCFHDPIKGYRVDKATGRPMILGDNPPAPATKKNDIETGEDQKGER
ncbi:MAG: hypothetical protein LBO05_07635 [Deltaproteobacteria bacterium]|jgi:hypothetical protein|nr:hypothetical protein [Deltaproteobacteria bacterium]